MHRTSNLVLPYEPQYTGHWEADRRREETREWLRQRERQLARQANSPSIVPANDEAEHSSDH